MKEFLNRHLFMMETYITCLLQMLSFSSRCRRLEMENLFRRPTIVAHNISQLLPPPPPVPPQNVLRACIEQLIQEITESHHQSRKIKFL